MEIYGVRGDNMTKNKSAQSGTRIHIALPGDSHQGLAIFGTIDALMELHGACHQTMLFGRETKVVLQTPDGKGATVEVSVAKPLSPGIGPMECVDLIDKGEGAWSLKGSERGLVVLTHAIIKGVNARGIPVGRRHADAMLINGKAAWVIVAKLEKDDEPGWAAAMAGDYPDPGADLAQDREKVNSGRYGGMPGFSEADKETIKKGFEEAVDMVGTIMSGVKMTAKTFDDILSSVPPITPSIKPMAEACADVKREDGWTLLALGEDVAVAKDTTLVLQLPYRLRLPMAVDALVVMHPGAFEAYGVAITTGAATVISEETPRDAIQVAVYATKDATIPSGAPLCRMKLTNRLADELSPLTVEAYAPPAGEPK